MQKFKKLFYSIGVTFIILSVNIVYANTETEIYESKTTS